MLADVPWRSQRRSSARCGLHTSETCGAACGLPPNSLRSWLTSRADSCGRSHTKGRCWRSRFTAIWAWTVLLHGADAASRVSTGKSNRSLLMQFAVAGRYVWSVDFFLRDDGVQRRRSRVELAGIFAGQRGGHEPHPDGQGGVAAGLLLAEGFLFVIADPDAAGERWRETNEPGVGEVVGCACLAGQRIRHLCGGDGCAVEYHFPQHGCHDARGARTDGVFDVGEIFFQNAAFIVGYFADVAWSDAHAIIGKNAEG